MRGESEGREEGVERVKEGKRRWWGREINGGKKEEGRR